MTLGKNISLDAATLVFCAFVCMCEVKNVPERLITGALKKVFHIPLKVK